MIGKCGVSTLIIGVVWFVLVFVLFGPFVCVCFSVWSCFVFDRSCVFGSLCSFVVVVFCFLCGVVLVVIVFFSSMFVCELGCFVFCLPFVSGLFVFPGD